MSFLLDGKRDGKVTTPKSSLALTASPQIIAAFDQSPDDLITYFDNFNQPFIDGKYSEIPPLIITDKFTDKAFIGYDYYTGDNKNKLSLRLNRSILPLDKHPKLPLEFGTNVGTPTPLIYRQDIAPGTYKEIFYAY